MNGFNIDTILKGDYTESKIIKGSMLFIAILAAMVLAVIFVIYMLIMMGPLLSIPFVMFYIFNELLNNSLFVSILLSLPSTFLWLGYFKPNLEFALKPLNKLDWLPGPQ